MTRSVAFRSPNWLGDAVMSTVVPPALKRARAVAHVTVLSPRNLVDIFAGGPGVDDVVALDPAREVDAYRTGGYDLVVVAPTSFGSAWRAWRGRVPAHGFATSGRRLLLRGWLAGSEYRRDRHQVENYRALASLVGEPREGDEPAVVVDGASRRDALEMWPRTGRRRVALQPGATYGPAKRWAPDRFARLARGLSDRGHDVAVVGGVGDRRCVDRVLADAGGGVVDLAGGTGVGTLAAFLESADLLVTNDTGPMHLAAAVGTRTLALFGSTNPVWTAPRGEHHRVLRHPVPCSPCFRRTCPIGTPCLEGIEAETVLREALFLLEETRS